MIEQLTRVLVDLDLVAAFERTARYGNTLSGWASEADGSSEDVTTSTEVGALWHLLQVDDPRDPRANAAAKARTDFVDHLMLSGTGTSEAGAQVERDRDWRRAMEHQRKLRELESHASTAIPGAVLRYLAHTAPPDTPTPAIVMRVGSAFASLKLRKAWDLAQLRTELARLERRAARPAGGRPPVDRSSAPPGIARTTLGTELVEWAVAAWLGEPFATPAWVPAGYRVGGSSDVER